MEQNKMKKFSLGFTLHETLLCITLIGLLLVITAKGISRISINKDISSFKKAYLGIENTVGFLMNDELIYGTAAGFKDTDPVTIDKIGQTIGQNHVSKFRDAFKYHMHFVEDKIDCPIYGGISPSGCFQTDYGVVFGIPNTDFVSKGVVKTKDIDGDDITVVPITFYTNYKPGQNINDDAFVATVTYDGKIYFINTVECGNDSKQMQCNLKKYVHSTSVKVEN